MAVSVSGAVKGLSEPFSGMNSVQCTVTIMVSIQLDVNTDRLITNSGVKI